MDMMHSVLFAFPPVAPSGLAFDSLTGTLSWTDNSRSETAFVVEKSQDGGISWVEVGRVDRQLLSNAGSSTGGTESFTDPVWAMGDQYRVIAQNTVGDTADYGNPGFNEIPVGTFAFPVVTTTAVSEVIDSTPPPAPPAAPTDLTATPDATPQASLAWTDVATDETGYVVERSTDGGVNFSVLATLGADAISHVDLAVTAGNAYDYRVAAFNAGGPSAYSNTATATIPGLQAPNAPNALEAVVEADIPMIHLTWADNSLDETGFVIQRSTDGVAFSDLANIGANVATYDDLAVFGGYTYTYRVAAFNANGTSAYSNTASGIMPPDATPPAAPSNLSAASVTQTSLRLNWQDNSNNELGFTVQRATNSTFTKNVVNINVGPNVSFYDFIGLNKNTKYFFRLLAFNANFSSPWSPTLNITTPK
jgi:titin